MPLHTSRQQVVALSCRTGHAAQSHLVALSSRASAFSSTRMRCCAYDEAGGSCRNTSSACMRKKGGAPNVGSCTCGGCGQGVTPCGRGARQAWPASRQPAAGLPSLRTCSTALRCSSSLSSPAVLRQAWRKVLPCLLALGAGLALRGSAPLEMSFLAAWAGVRFFFLSSLPTASASCSAWVGEPWGHRRRQGGGGGGGGRPGSGTGPPQPHIVMLDLPCTLQKVASAGRLVQGDAATLLSPARRPLGLGAPEVASGTSSGRRLIGLGAGGRPASKCKGARMGRLAAALPIGDRGCALIVAFQRSNCRVLQQPRSHPCPV